MRDLRLWRSYICDVVVARNHGYARILEPWQGWAKPLLNLCSARPNTTFGGYFAWF